MKQLKLFTIPATRAPEPRKPNKAPVVKVNHVIANKRYYYRRLLKDRYPMNTTKRLIKVPYRTFEEIPKVDRWYIGQLIKFGYNMQYEIEQ